MSSNRTPQPNPSTTVSPENKKILKQLDLMINLLARRLSTSPEILSAKLDVNTFIFALQHIEVIERAVNHLGIPFEKLLELHTRDGQSFTKKDFEMLFEISQAPKIEDKPQHSITLFMPAPILAPKKASPLEEKQTSSSAFHHR